MHEIAKVTLENEMDLILAHKRSMKLAELATLSLSAQTTFATAVSEVSRNIIEDGKSGKLILYVDLSQPEKFIVASLREEQPGSQTSFDGLEYAKRLVSKYNVFTKNGDTIVELYFLIPPFLKLTAQKLDDWRRVFRNEPPISPYEELKRKNEQLEILSEKVNKSEAQYKILTNALPIIIFSLDNDGQLLYANKWLETFTGETVEALNESKWKNVVHEEDYDSFSLLLKNNALSDAASSPTQTRLRQQHTGEYLWHQVSLTAFKDDQGVLQYWIGYIVDIHAQKVFEETLKHNFELVKAQEELKRNQGILEKYIAELNRSNYELQQFAFVASHDLQEPIRKILFYCDYLLQSNATASDRKSLDYLKSMYKASQRMRSLIQDLLTFSQINKEELKFQQINLNNILRDALQDLELSIEERKAKISIPLLPQICGDERMIRQLFENIISNAIKYSRSTVTPVVAISCQEKEGNLEIAFKDNGIGFDEQYLPQMFTLFQRLHTRDRYEGTGLGLAICKKITDIHHGRIWAQGKEGEGSIFYISLPMNHQQQ
ncbi:MAG: ATP-binding protein [Flavisolibacter sp.]